MWLFVQELVLGTGTRSTGCDYVIMWLLCLSQMRRVLIGREMACPTSDDQISKRGKASRPCVFLRDANTARRHCKAITLSDLDFQSHSSLRQECQEAADPTNTLHCSRVRHGTIVRGQIWAKASSYPSRLSVDAMMSRTRNASIEAYRACAGSDLRIYTTTIPGQ